MLLIGASHLIQQIFQALFLINCTHLSELVRTGRLDFLLLLPVNSRFIISVRQIDLGALVNAAVSNLIREGKTFQIPSIMQTGKKLGMVTLNDSLVDLVAKKIVEPEEAYLKAIDKQNLVSSFKARNIPLDFMQERTRAS